MKPDTLASILVRHGLVDAAAVHDPEGCDNYVTLSRIKAAAVELDAAESKVDYGPAELQTACYACKHWSGDSHAVLYSASVVGWCSERSSMTDAVDECEKFKAREPAARRGPA